MIKKFSRILEMEKLIDWNKRPSTKSKFKWINEHVKVEKVYPASQIYDFASHLAYKIKKINRLSYGSHILLIFEPSFDFLVVFLACILSKMIPICVCPNNILNLHHIITDSKPDFCFMSPKFNSIIHQAFDTIFNTPDIEERFNSCILLINKYKYLIKIGVNEMLVLYGAYKQSMFGDADQPGPPIYLIKKYMKWSAWNKLKGQTKLEAKTHYCEIVKTIVNNNNTKDVLLTFPSEMFSIKDDISNLSDLYKHQSQDYSPDETLFMQYSSGSTNNPKGIMISQSNIYHNIQSIIHKYRNRTHGKCLNWLPHYHDMGLIGNYLTAYVSSLSQDRNITFYSMAPQTFILNPNKVMKFISDHRVQGTALPNFAMEVLIENFNEDKLDLSELEIIFTGAEKIRNVTLQRFINKFAPFKLRSEAIMPCYGLAEYTLVVSQISYNEKDVYENNVSVGKPTKGTKILILKDKEVCKEGETGDIFITGPSKAKGYFNKNELTKEIFNHKNNGVSYLKTGDLGFMKNGHLYINGRSKECIILNGRNYYPEDLEDTVNNIDLIRNGCVCAFSTEIDNKERLIILAEVYSETHMPSFSIVNSSLLRIHNTTPAIIAFVPMNSLEKTTSGKLRRSFIKQKWIENSYSILKQYGQRMNEFINSELDQAIVEDFAYIFNYLEYKKEKNSKLYELGVDSITYSRAIQQVKKKMNSLMNSEINLQYCYELTLEEFYNFLLFLYGKNGCVDQKIFKKHWKYDLPDELRERMLQDRVLDLSTLPTPTEEGKGMPNNPDYILLTGGTGFFGNYLLQQLIERTTSKIFLLVRANSVKHAYNRIIASLEKNNVNIDFEEINKRCFPFPGDTDLKHLGIENDDLYEELLKKIDVVFHCAANVNYVLPYEHMQGNIISTKNIIDFCYRGKRKELHYASTLIIFGWTTKKTLLESDNNDDCRNVCFGYAQTKWVAEQLVIQAGNNGLKTKVYRPTFLTASITTNGYNEFDIVSKYILFSLKHRVAAVGPNNINIFAVDLAAQNMVTLSMMDDFYGKNFHLSSSYTDYVGVMSDIVEKQLNIKFKRYNYEEFLEYLNENGSPSDQLYPLIPFANENYSYIQRMENKQYGNEYTKNCFVKYGLVYAERELSVLLESIIKYLRRKRLTLL
jgi:thioester reductase-like protein